MVTGEDDAAKLDRIVIQVQAGMSIHDALHREKLYRWYYRELDKSSRAPVDRARAEYTQMHQKGRPNTSGFSIVVECHMPIERHQKFKNECLSRGTTMNRTINSLVNDWLNSPAGTGGGVGSKV